MDMARYTTLFLAEAEDHLRQSDEMVHSLERDGDCRENLHALFRHLHSLKGMAATMGFGDMSRISHALEDLLDRSRKDTANGAVPGEDLVLVSNGLAYIRTMVRAVGGGRSLDSPDAAALADLIRRRLAEPRPATPPQAAPLPTRSDEASEPQEDGKTAWEIELRMDDEGAGSTGKVVDLVNRLGALGSVRHISPPLPCAGQSGFGKRISLLLESSLSRKDLENAMSTLKAIQSYRLAPGPAGKPAKRTGTRSARFVRVRADLLDRLMENSLELTLAHEKLSGILEGARDPGQIRSLQRCRQLVENQYSTLTELRLVPFESVANRIRAGVDALSTRQGKKIRFRMEGLMVRLDRSLLESLVDPLLHIMRNAIDHGIESAEARVASGKSPEGTISLRLTREGNEVRFTIEDDGCGMSTDELRERAVELEFMTREQAGRLSGRECYFLVTLPGFSTVSRVGEVSGRGVGMDVVRSEVESLGGRLEISSGPGKGTLFALELPQSMAIIQALLVRCRRSLYAVPVASISRTLAVRDAGLVREGDRLFLSSWGGGEPLPVIRMNPDDEPSSLAAAVALLPPGGRGEAILVDEVLGRREVLVRPLDPPLRMLKEYSGAAMLGDGSIALVIDPRNLSA